MAAIAGVSIATVSKFINSTQRFTAAVERKIQAAIDEVSKRPGGVGGLRGAVLLQRGTYRVEGALAIRDFDAAVTALGAMSSEELHRPEVKALRIELARATGHEDLAGRLESEG